MPKLSNVFDKDGNLKILRQWTFEGKSYSARRDSDGCIGIVDDEKYFSVSSRDHCFMVEDIDNLAISLGVMEKKEE